MPGRDGIATLELLCASPALGPKTAVLLLATAFDHEARERPQRSTSTLDTPGIVTKF